MDAWRGLLPFILLWTHLGGGGGEEERRGEEERKREIRTNIYGSGQITMLQFLNLLKRKKKCQLNYRPIKRIKNLLIAHQCLFLPSNPPPSSSSSSLSMQCAHGIISNSPRCGGGDFSPPSLSPPPSCRVVGVAQIIFTYLGRKRREGGKKELGIISLSLSPLFSTLAALALTLFYLTFLSFFLGN